MNINFIGALFEYCQRNRLANPIFNQIEHSGPHHDPRFRMQVNVRNQTFVGNRCSKLQDAKHSAAQVAFESLSTPYRPMSRRTQILRLPPPTTPSPPPRQVSPQPIPSAPSGRSRSLLHLPAHHADIEDFIANLVGNQGGRIRKIWDLDNQREYQFEITGSFRVCGNVGRNHQKNHIYLKVNPHRMFYYQKCHDKECFGYQSPHQAIPRGQRRSSNSFNDDDDDDDDKYRSKRHRVY